MTDDTDQPPWAISTRPTRSHFVYPGGVEAIARDRRHDWLAELDALYARADTLYAAWSCPNSAECCHFGVTGRQPYVTEIELSAIRAALAALESAPNRHVRRLPLASSPNTTRPCPLLNERNRCSVYEVRPLGCRSYYCGRAQRGAGPEPEALDAIVAELQLLAARHHLGGERARPLVLALADGWLSSV